MMQSILFLKDTDDGPVQRIINLDRLSCAARDPETGSTILLVSGAEIKMGMKFEDFLAHVEKLIADNYRISNESAVAWHNKRVKDNEEAMRSVIKEAMMHDH